MQYIQAYLQESVFASTPGHQGVQYAICAAFGREQVDSDSGSEDLGAASDPAPRQASPAGRAPNPSDLLQGRLATEQEHGGRCPICLDDYEPGHYLTEWAGC
eukprot:4061787-Alexandrium_andersonii.AAC.1